MNIPSADLDHLSAVISHATAPAFMLGAVAAFLSVLISRFERVIDRVRAMRGSDPVASRSEALASFSRRAELLNRAIFFAVLSALCTAALLIVAFASAYLGFNHHSGVAVMFIVALLLLMMSLGDLAREVRLNLKVMHLDS